MISAATNRTVPMHCYCFQHFSVRLPMKPFQLLSLPTYSAIVLASTRCVFGVPPVMPVDSFRVDTSSVEFELPYKGHFGHTPRPIVQRDTTSAPRTQKQRKNSISRHCAGYSSLSLYGATMIPLAKKRIDDEMVQNWSSRQTVCCYFQCS